jgi:2-polyprenyl-3-methyl-5-hydroxy-6-metoxy-1,4-benzoquinol methylase
LTEYYRKKCPYCDGEGSHHFKFCSTNYYKCSSCDLIYKNSNKSYEEIVLQYRNHYYDNFGAIEVDGKRDKLFIEILKSLEQKIQTGKILDVGTGCGFFLQFAKERGWKVRGIDPSPKSVNIAKNINNLDVTVGTLEI